MRVPLLIAATIASGVSGLVVASVVVGDEPQRPVPDEHDDARAGSARIAARTSDPSGGPDWAVRAYDGGTGLRCVAVGRADERRFGRVDTAGNVTETAVDDSGSCADPAVAPLQLAVSRQAPTATDPASAVLFGTVDRARITSLEILDPRGRLRQVDLRSGAVILVSLGDAGGEAWRIIARFEDGHEETFTL